MSTDYNETKSTIKFGKGEWSTPLFDLKKVLKKKRHTSLPWSKSFRSLTGDKIGAIINGCTLYYPEDFPDDCVKIPTEEEAAKNARLRYITGLGARTEIKAGASQATLTPKGETKTVTISLLPSISSLSLPSSSSGSLSSSSSGSLSSSSSSSLPSLSSSSLPSLPSPTTHTTEQAEWLAREKKWKEEHEAEYTAWTSERDVSYQENMRVRDEDYQRWNAVRTEQYQTHSAQQTKEYQEFSARQAKEYREFTERQNREQKEFNERYNAETKIFNEGYNAETKVFNDGYNAEAAERNARVEAERKAWEEKRGAEKTEWESKRAEKVKEWKQQCECERTARGLASLAAEEKARIEAVQERIAAAESSSPLKVRIVSLDSSHAPPLRINFQTDEKKRMTITGSVPINVQRQGSGILISARKGVMFDQSQYDPDTGAANGFLGDLKNRSISASYFDIIANYKKDKAAGLLEMSMSSTIDFSIGSRVEALEFIGKQKCEVYIPQADSVALEPSRYVGMSRLDMGLNQPRQFFTYLGK